MKLKELRTEASMTQEELASRLNLKYYNIGDWERGKCEPSIEFLVKLARIFNVTIDYLVGNSDELGNVVPGDDFNEEEKKLVLCYRGIGKAERLALMTTAQSFYNQAKENKRKVIV